MRRQNHSSHQGRTIQQSRGFHRPLSALQWRGKAFRSVVSGDLGFIIGSQRAEFFKFFDLSWYARFGHLICSVVKVEVDRRGSAMTASGRYQTVGNAQSTRRLPSEQLKGFLRPTKAGASPAMANLWRQGEHYFSESGSIPEATIRRRSEAPLAYPTSTKETQ